MINYAICEISGKQYKVVPNQALEVDFQGVDAKEIEAQVLMLSEDDKIKLGDPYLKEKLKLTCLEMIKKDKIRVARFHAKANYRRVIGHRAKMTKVIFSVKS